MEVAEHWAYTVLVLAGVAAGFINTIAGGGSMLTLPALMLLGMPADVANGTNRLGVATQAISGVLAFRKRGKLPEKAIVPMLIPAGVGCALGASAATLVPQWLLKPVLLGTMMTMAIVVALQPRRSEDSELEEQPAAVGLKAFTSLFAAGIYGGFVQAGVGFPLLITLSRVLRYDLVRANALKLVIALVLGVVALVVFAAAGDIDWTPAAALAGATVAGYQLGVRFAVAVSERTLRIVLLVAILTACLAAFVKG